MNETDCRLLASKVWPDRKWHDIGHMKEPLERYKAGDRNQIWTERDKTVVRNYMNNSTFTTVHECWDVMQWAFQQEWWEGVYLFAWCRYHEEQHTSGQCSTLHGYIKWLFQKPAHLPELVLQYGKEVLGWEPKGG